MSRRASPPPGELPGDPSDRGMHTLRVHRGAVVGVDGDDVFVELGPRMQGVISLRQFEERPRIGDEFDFTLHGQEDELWALSRVEAGTLATWREMEVASWVQARVTGRNHGGLELRVGPLHGFMPKSETGLDRTEDPAVLVGTTLTCEVIEIDRERQRVLLSRKRVARKERESRLQREAGALVPGRVVHGRVSRIEPYGAFVRFGAGLEGLVHVSNLSVDRVEHPSEVLEKGQNVEAVILTVRREGKRIGLGIKQLSESPWKRLDRELAPDQLLVGTVTRLADFGVFVAVRRGVEGLLHDSQSGLGPGRRLREVCKPGDRLALRVLDLDLENERLSLSRLHRSGARVREEDVLAPEEREDLDERGDGAATTNLGRLLARALPRDAGSRERPTG